MKMYNVSFISEIFPNSRYLPENMYKKSGIAMNYTSQNKIYIKEQKIRVKFPYFKFNSLETVLKTSNEYCNSCHYKCVLGKTENKDEFERILKDDNYNPVIFTHSPYFSGLEPLFQKGE